MTKAEELEKWLKQAYPKSVRISSKDRAHGNHSHGNAIDVVGIEKLPKEDQENILNTAMKLGLRVGDELQGKKGVGGYTGAHYHFDATRFKGLGDQLVHFRRGGKTGGARRSARSRSENIKNDQFVKRMQELSKNPLVYGPTTEEIKYGATPAEPVKEESKAADRGLSLEEQLALYAQMNPESDNITEQRKAVDKEISGQDQVDMAKRIAGTDMNLMMGAGSTGKVKSDKDKEIEQKKKDVIQQGVGEKLVKERPQDVAQVVDGIVEDEQTASEIKQDIALKATGNDQARSPISAQFTDALTYFLPTIIGGLGGLAFGGEQAAIAGAEAGSQLGASYAKFNLQERELAQQQQLQAQRQLDVGSFVDENGKPVQMNMVTGQFTDLQGKPVDPNKVQRTNLYKQKQGLGFKRSEAERKGLQFSSKMTEGQQKDTLRAMSDFRTDNKQDIEQNQQIANLQNLINNDLVTPDQVATFNAKVIFGETRITDEDVERAGIPLNAWKRVQNDMTAWAAGKLSKDAQLKATQILSTISKFKSKELRERIERQAGSKALQRRSGLSKEELVEEFSRKAELSPIKSGAKKVKSGASLMSDEQRKRLAELRAKRDKGQL